jgi:hypothetical protein
VPRHSGQRVGAASENVSRLPHCTAIFGAQTTPVLRHNWHISRVRCADMSRSLPTAQPPTGRNPAAAVPAHPGPGIRAPTGPVNSRNLAAPEPYREVMAAGVAAC